MPYTRRSSAALRRLDQQARTLERAATGPSMPELIAEEFARSHDYGGRSVFGFEAPIEPVQPAVRVRKCHGIAGRSVIGSRLLRKTRKRVGLVRLRTKNGRALSRPSRFARSFPRAPARTSEKRALPTRLRPEPSFPPVGSTDLVASGGQPVHATFEG